MAESDDAREGQDDRLQTAGRAETAAETLDKPALMDRVAAASGVPKPQIRKILDAVLTEIGAALDSGANLSLPPLGKLRLVRTSDQGGNQVHTMRLRRSPAKTAKDEGESDAPPSTAGALARARVQAGVGAARASVGADTLKANAGNDAAGDPERQQKPSKAPRQKTSARTARAGPPSGRARGAADDGAGR